MHEKLQVFFPVLVDLAKIRVEQGIGGLHTEEFRLRVLGQERLLGTQQLGNGPLTAVGANGPFMASMTSIADSMDSSASWRVKRNRTKKAR
jgi:hypothetical protein